MSESRKLTSEAGQAPTEAERISWWSGTNWEEKLVYEDELPPASPFVEVTTVVPVHKEFENNNFWRLLRSAVEQDASSETFEMILVVNNTAKAPAGSPQATRSGILLTCFARNAIGSWHPEPYKDGEIEEPQEG